MRVLLVEDDERLAARLAEGLREQGFVVEHADNGHDGYVMAVDHAFEAIILDLGLPEMEGLEALRRWRAGNVDTPVLVLTARSAWTEKVEGLNAGADDYIGKPFHIPEVAARLRALSRRQSGTAGPLLKHGDLQLEPASGAVTFRGEQVEVTAIELKMLSYFMRRINRLVTQQDLADAIYGSQDNRDSNTVEVYVSRLRRKLGKGVIKTVRGLGYKME